MITAKKPAKINIYIDIKNKKEKYGKRDADRWITLSNTLEKEDSKAIFMTYSETGYTKGTKERLKENGILVLKNECSENDKRGLSSPLCKKPPI